MAGRGRGLTLPAWMTSAEYKDSNVELDKNNNGTEQTTQSSAVSRNDLTSNKTSRLGHQSTLSKENPTAPNRPTQPSSHKDFSSTPNAQSKAVGTFSNPMPKPNPIVPMPPMYGNNYPYIGNPMSANQGTSMPIAASHSHGPFGLQPGGYQVMMGMGGMPTTMGGVAGSMAMGNSFGGIPNAVAPAPPAPPMTLPGKQGSHFLAAPPLMMHARPPPPPLPPQQRPNIAPAFQMIPTGMGGPGAPIPSNKPAAGISDPNNDASCWSEHVSEESGTRYWYNRSTRISTYEKPLCLKSPEERSIPPCAWKEYAAEGGRKYYSNGKESMWTMPEEFKAWKERVEAAELKHQRRRQEQEAEATKNVLSGEGRGWGDAVPGSTMVAGNDQTQRLPAPHADAGSTQALRAQGKSLYPASKTLEGAAVAAGAGEKVEYISHAEAVEAFKQLLADRHVSAGAKMKEAQEACQADPRWDALRSQGEKKQALAEYQTRRLKQEKEQQKARARRHRDSFLLMLAEHTEIDARSSWREAAELLQHDQRFKNVDDARDREDLFEDFVGELEKKEKLDVQRQRDAARTRFEELLQELHAAGEVSRKSVWADWKRDHLARLQAAEREAEQLRGLDELDARRSFQALVDGLQEAHRQAERRRKEEFRMQLVSQRSALKALMLRLGATGLLTAESRWKDVSNLPAFTSAQEYIDTLALFRSRGDKDESLSCSAVCRELCEAVVAELQDAARAHRKLLRDVLADQGVELTHRMTFCDMKALLLKAGKLRAIDQVDGSCTYAVVSAEGAGVIEEGEEAEGAGSAGSADDGGEVGLGSKEEKYKRSSRSSRSKSRDSRHKASDGRVKDREEGDRAHSHSHSYKGGDRDEKKRKRDPNAAPDEALMKRVRDVLLKVFNDEYGEGGIVAEAAVSKEMAGSNGSSGAATSASGHCGGGEAQLRRAFEELHERAVRAYEEEQRYARRAEEKFRALLQEYFYLSDQVNLDWELAKKKIQSRSAYDNLPRADRKRLFQEHMDALKQKYKAKEKALTALNGSDEVPHVLVLSESKAVGAEVEICKSTALSGTKDGDNVKGSAVVASSSSGLSSTRQPHTRSKRKREDVRTASAASDGEVSDD